MDYDRLRELQAKFDENPRRYFAPLANEYRKGGNPKRAIEICRAHLAQMPGHMSGQVVYGQALFEGAEYDEARKVFEGALVLDPENLIALRSLGDLALQSGDTAEARRYYSRLLEADPKDAAVIALVAELDESGDASGTAPAAAAGEMPPVEFAATEKPPAPPRESAAESPGDSEFTVDFSFVDLPTAAASSTESSAVEGLTSHQPEAKSPLAEVEAKRSETESAVSEGDAPMGLERHYESAESGSATSTTADSASAAAESEPPSMAKETLPVAEPMGPGRDAMDFPATSSFAGSTPEPFVNETMAQLYLQQGYKQLALRVYRQLSEMRPTEQALRDRIAEIEASQTTEGERPRSPSIESPLPS
jgi:tetratricopeptide (TPR) repeat protein